MRPRSFCTTRASGQRDGGFNYYRFACAVAIVVVAPAAFCSMLQILCPRFRKHPGTRRLLDIEWCARLADRLANDARLLEFLPANAHAVQCTLFAKTAESNWLVSPHQDLSIPVAERVDSPACSGWSHKQSHIFVQPPISALDNVLAVRLHLDDCDERNGALCVVPGSHRPGRLSPDGALRRL
jgi:hypothetical protein